MQIQYRLQLRERDRDRQTIYQAKNAADMDYRAVVVADGCSDKDPEVQRVLMEKIFPNQARVAMVEECIGAIHRSLK